MQKKKKKQLPAMLFVIPVIITAYSCRMLAKFDIGGEIFSLVRAMIYLALFDVWIVRVKRTVQQRSIQRYLLIAGGMMVFWIFVRTVKYEFELPPTAIRLCWYIYYLPMLTIPLMGLLTAITIGKLESRQFGRKAAVLCIVTGILLLAVLTNDFHQLVFTFPEDVPFFQRLDKNYGYNFLYFIIFGWIGFCGLAALVIMWKKCKVPNTKKHLLKPLIPTGLSMGYSAIYLTEFSWLTFWFGDLPVTQSLLFVATYEACFSCGLIPTNARYIDLFEASSESSAQITDRDFNIRYKASDAQAVTKELMALAINEPFPLDDGRVLHTMPIHGGYAVWTEDNSELIALQEELSLLKEEWQERNALLQSEYLLEEKRRKILEQNRLYDMLQAVTQKQIDKIALLMKEYQSKEKTLKKAEEFLQRLPCCVVFSNVVNIWLLLLTENMLFHVQNLSWHFQNLCAHSICLGSKAACLLIPKNSLMVRMQARFMTFSRMCLKCALIACTQLMFVLLDAMTDFELQLQWNVILISQSCTLNIRRLNLITTTENRPVCCK